MLLRFELTTTMDLGEGITAIAIVGGPCGGKTSGLAKLIERLSDRGYKVLVCPESATKLMKGGILPWELRSLQFQRQVLLDTLMQEERFFEAAKYYRDLGFKVVILFDRGAIEGEAYIPKEEFAGLIKSFGFNYQDLCERRYHAVMHMRTAALGAPEHYSLENNKTRTETLEYAIEVDQRILEAWQRHYHPRVIDNSTGFEEKLDRLFAEVCAVLGDPVPVEKEDKFLIEPFNPPDVPVFTSVSVIAQDYLVALKGGEERRVRSRGDEHGATYFYTVKEEISPDKRLERERIISEEEYFELLKEKDPAYLTVKKRRVCFFHKEQFFEADLFEAPEEYRGLSLLEAEWSDRSPESILPPFMKVIRKVTGDKRYSNKAIAKAA